MNTEITPHKQVEDNLEFTVETDESGATTIIASLRIRQAVKLSNAVLTALTMESVKERISGRFSVGMHGFDSALAHHLAQSDGKRVEKLPASH